MVLYSRAMSATAALHSTPQQMSGIAFAFHPIAMRWADWLPCPSPRRRDARWTGPSNTFPPQPLDTALIFAPVGDLVPLALRAVRKGGCVVCAGIHMCRVPAFDYELLWGECSIRSVANLTRNVPVQAWAILRFVNGPRRQTV